ncbi:hypothetical protein EYF80_010324 [Liparis tanakae]|uniref:Uncharacterized protein n=1 Tax=Liparis tanakae TaxID=230148 RepID=A0A4Z2INY8_9TELE|nr:hypothetical protein EYF80_010324 [Liparis tanakae]
MRIQRIGVIVLGVDVDAGRAVIVGQLRAVCAVIGYLNAKVLLVRIGTLQAGSSSESAASSLSSPSCFSFSGESKVSRRRPRATAVHQNHLDLIGAVRLLHRLSLRSQREGGSTNDVSDCSLSVNELWRSTPSFTATVSIISASIFPVPLADPGRFSSLSARDGVLCWACSSGAAWSGLGLERSSGEELSRTQKNIIFTFPGLPVLVRLGTVLRERAYRSTLDHTLVCVGLPDAGGQAGVRRIAFLLWSLGEIGDAAPDHRLALVKHQVQPIVGQLDEDEEDGDGGAVDAQRHGGRGQGLWRGEELHHIQNNFSRDLTPGKQCLIECFPLGLVLSSDDKESHRTYIHEKDKTRA